jgi:hypothetical protein
VRAREVSTNYRGTVLLNVDLQANAHILWENHTGAWAVPSPDCRHLAIEGGTVNSNMWMMENFRGNQCRCRRERWFCQAPNRPPKP